MNTATSLFLFGVIVAFFIYDANFHDWENSIFLGRKFRDFLTALAIWR